MGIYAKHYAGTVALLEYTDIAKVIKYNVPLCPDIHIFSSLFFLAKKHIFILPSCWSFAIVF